jgi:hypothetical protein
VAGSSARVALGAPKAADSLSASSSLRNVAPSPNYFDICGVKGRNNPQCITLVVEAIEHARSHEHMTKRALILPNNYRYLSVAKQTFVITNLERVDRGLRPYTGLTASLNHVSQIAAALKADPTIGTSLLHTLGIGTWGSIWAEDLGPLAADYDWMYNDGYAGASGINVACRTPGAAGCWGHRHNILYPFKGFSVLSAGAGTAKPAGASIAEILTGSYGAAPRYSYTFKNALAHGANGHRVTARVRHR